MKKWEDENAGTFLVLRRKTGMIIDKNLQKDNDNEWYKIYNRKKRTDE